MKRPTTVEIQHRRGKVNVVVRFGDTRQLSITVHPDQSVTATAPIKKTVAQVTARIQARAAWIARQQEAFARFKPLPTERRYVSGETHPYLGRQYRLKVLRGDTDQVSLTGGRLNVFVSDIKDTDEVRRLVQQWYLDRAQVVLPARYAHWVDRLTSAGISSGTPRLRRMSRRWGSCSTRGNILLNPELIKAPSGCIDYVVVHELCHLKVMRHDRRFYRLLRQYLPDWEKRKQRLDRILL